MSCEPRHELRIRTSTGAYHPVDVGEGIGRPGHLIRNFDLATRYANAIAAFLAARPDGLANAPAFLFALRAELEAVGVEFVKCTVEVVRVGHGAPEVVDDRSVWPYMVVI